MGSSVAVLKAEAHSGSVGRISEINPCLRRGFSAAIFAASSRFSATIYQCVNGFQTTDLW